MTTLRLALVIGGLLFWQPSLRAEDAVMLKAYTFQDVRNGFLMPKRTLSKGAIVKVLATHGAKADVVTSGGSKVTVRWADLRILPDPSSPVTVAVQQPAAVTPTPPVLQQPPAAVTPTPAVLQPPAATPAPPTPAPSPNPVPSPPPKETAATADDSEKTDSTGPARPGETGKRSVPVRCSHMTKKGEQCSRMTSSPNGSCWQHGGD